MILSWGLGIVLSNDTLSWNRANSLVVMHHFMQLRLTGTQLWMNCHLEVVAMYAAGLVGMASN